MCGGLERDNASGGTIGRTAGVVPRGAVAEDLTGGAFGEAADRGFGAVEWPVG